ncbi:MAG: hypothetical protein HQ556_03200 [Candidatus Marinimicrobia bacterium]|nr:hypothetical protein [Candidatus Neomarinimicrobiota bacterium]
MYKVLDWQSLRGEMEYEFDDQNDYDRLKEEQLRSSISLENKTEIEEFYADCDTLPINGSNQWSFHKSLSKLMEWLNKDMAHHLLKTLVVQGNRINLNPQAHLFEYIKTNEDADECWELLNSGHFEGKTYWQLAYFEMIDDSLINETFPDRIMSVIADNDRSLTILFDRLVRYLQFDPQLFKHILIQILEDHAAGGFHATGASHTFEEHFANLGDDLDIIKRAYILHCSLFDHFDYRSKGLLNILNVQPSFLVEYVDSLYEKEDTRLTGGHEELGIVWLVDGIEEQIRAVFEIIIRHEDFLGILPDFGNSFYRKLPPEVEHRAKRFLFSYLRQNISHPRKLNIVVDIANNSRPDIFEDLLLEYLQLNHDVEIFSQIHWKKEVGAQMGDTSFGDLWAEEWIRVRDVVMKSSLGIELVPIKKFLADQIESSRSYANIERQRRFIRSRRF